MREQQYLSPLLQKRADPWIYKHTDGKYYCTATVPEYDGIELRIADSINGLAEARPLCVWKKHKEGEMSHLIWAPEIHYVRGSWYIYFAAAPTDDPCPEYGTFQHRMYVITAENPTGLWEELGQINSGMDTFCLDATVFEYQNKLYYLWAQKEPGIRGNSNLYLSEMENPWTLTGKHILLTKPEYEWECSVIPVNEGPAVLFCKNSVAVIYSANATGTEYCMGMLTAPLGSDLLDSANWKKSSRPVFETNSEKKRFGPGHCSFTIAEDGVTNLLVYHARTKSQINGDPLWDPGRNTYVEPFEFNHKGLPVFM